MKYPVVYSYKRVNTLELKLSLESLHNIKEWNGKVYIIGDEPGLDFYYQHLPIKHGWGKRLGKSSDEVCAYLSADFLDNFIIMADDMYILRAWNLERYNRGTLDQHIKWRSVIDSYSRQLAQTRRFLLQNEKRALSYELHTPTLVNYAQLKECAEIIRASNKPLLIRSLIGNWFNLDSIQTDDVKNAPLNNETILYSSSDKTFAYDKVRAFLL
jgi:hypothetical protein